MKDRASSMERAPSDVSRTVQLTRYVKHLGADKYRFKDTGGAGTYTFIYGTHGDTRGHTGTHAGTRM